MDRIRRPANRNRNLLVLHATVFIWGFTGILGALISIKAIYIVWYRLFIAFASLWLWFKLKKTDYKVSKQDFMTLFGTGAIVGLHWFLFFFSIKISTVSVTLVCLSSITLFTAILEPILHKKRIERLEICTGIAIIAGIYMIFKFESQYYLGIITGMLSALCASLFSVANSKFIKTHEAPIISFYELAGAWVWISIYLIASGGINSELIPNRNDLVYLLILGVLCTSVAYVAGVSVMRELSAFRVALIINLEPIYGILLALIFLRKKEQLSLGFYVGAAILLGSIFLYPYLKNRINKNKK